MGSSGTNLFVGIFLSVIGAIINGAGYIIQKLAHRKISQRPKEKQRHFARDPMWWFGFLVYAVGSLLQAAALAFAAQSLLTPMASLTLVANALMAPRFLGEKLAKKDIYATGIIVVGTVITVVFGPHDDTEFSTDELWALYIEKPFVAFSSVLGGVAVLDYIGVKYTQRKNRIEKRVLTGDLGEPTARFLALSYVFLAGTFSAYTLVLTKSTAEIVSQSFSGNNQFTNFLSWVMVVTFIAFNIFMEFWKQLALASFDALFVVPVAQVILVVLSTLAGGVYFKELGGLVLYQGLLFALGVLIICMGIYVLAQTEASETWKTILKVRKVMKLMKVINAFKSTRQTALKARLLNAAKLMKAKEAGVDVGDHPLAAFPFPGPDGPPGDTANAGPVASGGSISVSTSTLNALTDAEALASLRSADSDALAIVAEQQAVLLAVAHNDPTILLAGAVETGAGAVASASSASSSSLVATDSSKRRLSAAGRKEVDLVRALSQSDKTAESEAAKEIALDVVATSNSPQPVPQLANLVSAVASGRLSLTGKSPPTSNLLAPPPASSISPNAPTLVRVGSKPITVTASVEVDETRSRSGFHIPTQKYNSILGGLWEYLKTRTADNVQQLRTRLHFRDSSPNTANPVNAPAITNTEMKGSHQQQLEPPVEQPKLDIVVDPTDTGKAVTSTMIQEYDISAQEAELKDKQVPAVGETISRTITVTDDNKAQRTVSVLVIHRPSVSQDGGKLPSDGL